MDVGKGKTRLDSTKVEEGVWVVVDKTTKIKVARLGNDKYNEKLEKISADMQAVKHKKVLDRKELEAALREACIDTVLLSWEGIEEDGKELPYNFDNAKRLMTDPEFKEFQEVVTSLAQDNAIFRHEIVEEDVKKSERSSAGKTKQENTLVS